jgi:hypothetical protein
MLDVLGVLDMLDVLGVLDMILDVFDVLDMILDVFDVLDMIHLNKTQILYSSTQIRDCRRQKNIIVACCFHCRKLPKEKKKEARV